MNEAKLKTILSVLHFEKAGAMLITDPYHLRFLSGFRGGEGMLYLSEKQQVLITDSRYTEAAGKESDLTVIEENAAHKRVQILRECLEEDEVTALCYEDEDLRCSAFDKL